MSKLTFITLLVVFNAVFATKVFLGETNKMSVGVYSQLQKIESSSFGKNLLDTIALQVSNKAPLSEIARLLAELKSDLLHQQRLDDELHAQRETECEEAINAYNARIDYASNEITEATANIATLRNRIGQLELSIANYKANIQSSEDAVAESIATRATRAGQFESRNTQHQSVVDALDLILEKLDAFGSQGVDTETALAQLARIGKNNPIAAFVQVAAALNPESWDNVKNKLQNLRDATHSSMLEDADQERLEISNHNDYLTRMYALLESLRTALALDEQELVEQQADLRNEEVRLETNTTELHNATEGKAAKEQQCQQWRDQYFADSAQRSEEISIVEQVQEIFARKLDTAQGYLRDRMEADRPTL